MNHFDLAKDLVFLKTERGVLVPVHIPEIIHIIPKFNGTQVEAVGHNPLHEILLLELPLGKLVELFKECGLVQVHRSHAINVLQINNYDPDDHSMGSDGGVVSMKNGSKVPVGRTWKSSFLIYWYGFGFGGEQGVSS